MGDGAIVTRPHALRRILTNLIDNALKFGGSAEIEVQRRPEGTVTIKVLDRGPGIPEDQLEAVLRPSSAWSNHAAGIRAGPGSASQSPNSSRRSSAAP